MGPCLLKGLVWDWNLYRCLSEGGRQGRETGSHPRDSDVYPAAACLWTDDAGSSRNSQAEISRDGALVIFQHTKAKGPFLRCLPQHGNETEPTSDGKGLEGSAWWEVYSG